MVFLTTRRGMVQILAGLAFLADAGCTALQPAKPSVQGAEGVSQSPDALVTVARRVGWKEVKDLLPLLQAQPGAEFPGIAAFTADLNQVVRAEKTFHGVPPIDAARLIDRNPHFWNAYYEIAPGDPLMAMLHIGLLLSAGQAARADEVATLEIDFGRMDLAYRKELVRLDAHAQLVLQEGRGDVRGLDPLNQVDPQVAGPAPAALQAVRHSWLEIENGKASGDDRVLSQFSIEAQMAGLDELALVSRSLLAGWSRGPVPLDEGFARTGLQRLLGAAAAGDICAHAFAEGRQWLGLNIEDDATEVAQEGEIVHPQLEQRLLVQIAEMSYWIESGMVRGRALAHDYEQRGTAWSHLRKKTEAVADFRRSLELEPKADHVRYRLAAALSDGGDFSAADLAFADAARHAAADPGETQALGDHLFKEGRLDAAEVAFSRALRRDPSLAHSRIMRRLTLLREGKSGVATAETPAGRMDPWDASLLNFLAGGIDEKGLWSRLEPQAGLRYSEQECELYFVLGELALSRGEIAEARRDFRSCLGTGVTSVAWYVMAWHELRILDRAHPLPQQHPSSVGDSDDQPA